MKKNVHFFILLIFCIFSSSLYAQKEFAGSPRSFTESSFSLLVPQMELSAVDREMLLKQDEEKMRMGNPLRIGIMRPVYFTIENSGRLDVLDDGTRIWRLSIFSPDAFGMEIHLSNVVLPDGAEIFIYNSDKSIVSGPYTNKDIDENRDLFTEEICGEELIIEYDEPFDADFKGSFVV